VAVPFEGKGKGWGEEEKSLTWGDGFSASMYGEFVLEVREKWAGCSFGVRKKGVNGGNRARGEKGGGKSLLVFMGGELRGNWTSDG